MTASSFSISSGNADCSEDDRLKLLEISTSVCVPMALLCIAKLKVLDILQAANGQMLSAAEISSKMPRCRSPSNLDRILRLLASKEILKESVSKEDGVRRYGSTSVCKLLLQKPGLAFKLELQQRFPEAWLLLDDAVVEGVEPFEKLMGKTAFEYMQQNDAFGSLFNNAMSEYSGMVMDAIVRTYGKHFNSVGNLVDVGGGMGTTLATILAAHPHIKGINFDLPHVVARAPKMAGIEHVGGSMFESIPSTDTIFIKSVLHNWDDEACKAILRNCYQALPTQGKVMCVEIMLPSEVDHAPWARVALGLDMYMLAYLKRGRERSIEELANLAKAVGFTDLELVGRVDHLSVSILRKA